MPSPDLKPLLLDPANFTPRSRTPWGGPRLPALKAPHAAPIRKTHAHYGERFLAAVENGPLSATQFHPEKSGRAGIALLRNWVSALA